MSRPMKTDFPPTPPAVAPTFWLDLYDHGITAQNESVDVTCCLPDLSDVSVSCGAGVSCSGNCRARGATLCPTGDCQVCTGLHMGGPRSVFVFRA